MKKSTIGWLIAASLLLILGGMLFVGALSVRDLNLSDLSKVSYETRQYDIDTSIRNISVRAHTADIVILPSETDDISVKCYEQTHIHHTVTVEGDTLVMDVSDTREWYEHITIFGLEKQAVLIYLPSGTYGTVAISTTTGDIEIPAGFTWEQMTLVSTTGDVYTESSATGAMTLAVTTGRILFGNNTAGSASFSVTTGSISAGRFACSGDLYVEVGTGDVRLTDVTCTSLISKGTTGDLTLKNVIARDAFNLERTTGDVHFDRSDAAEIVVKVTTGDVTGTLLTDKTFVVKSTTGDVYVPQTTGGMCDVTSTTGDIDIDSAT